MKHPKRVFLLSILCALNFTIGANAQNATSMVDQLVYKYGDIPNYKVNITYEANNAGMGFNNIQEGLLVIKGNQYILKYGLNETWLNNGEYVSVGTKEENHSQIMYFCLGQNTESIVDYGSILSFYGSGHTATMDGNMIRLIPNRKQPYLELRLKVEDGNLKMMKAFDQLGTEHIYTFSGFSTSIPDTKFTINRWEYSELIDERYKCK